MTELRCFTCDGSFEADISDLANPTAEDYQILADAQAAHIATHPEHLKVDVPPAPPKRDWAGNAKRARGEHVRRYG